MPKFFAIGFESLTDECDVEIHTGEVALTAQDTIDNIEWLKTMNLGALPDGPDGQPIRVYELVPVGKVENIQLSDLTDD